MDRLAAALGDRYTIERELGAGGMATVFLAVDVRHERRVAIKVLHPELSAMLGGERFLSEIKLTASLQHPHILLLFDSGVADGLLYYVMPFVEGETLRGRLDRERQLPVADAVRLAGEIADGLQYAHERGVVHRDIKPENVLLQNGRAVVADFGIALAVQSAGGSRMTQTGMSLGTPQYMAPEQAMGERNVDARADIYALGAVTYEMLAGEPPFTGPTAQAIVAKVMTERSRPLRTIRDTVPESVERAVAQALEKLPADRFASAKEFARALSDITVSAAARSLSADPRLLRARTRFSVGRAIGIGPAALVAGVAIGAAAMASRTKPIANTRSLSVRFEVLPADSVQMRLVCCGRMFAISPDGRWLVYQGSARPQGGQAASSVARVGEHQLYLRDLTDLTVRRLPGTDNGVSIAFSPRNDEIVFVSGRELRRLPLSTGEPQRIATLPDGFVSGTAWGTDDVVRVSVSGLMLAVPASGGTPTPLFPRDTAGMQFAGPQMLLAERAILYTIAATDKEPVIQWRSLASGKVHAVAVGATPTYLPEIHSLLLVRADGTLMRYPFDAARGDTTGPGVRVAAGVVRRSPILAHGEYDVSEDGTLILATRRSAALLGGVSLVRLDDSVRVSRIMEPFRAFTRPVFSPSGAYVAMTAALDQGAYVAQIFDVARGVAARAPIESDAASLAWTATGDSLVYRIRGRELVVRAADGSGVPTPPLVVKDWTIAEDISSWGPWIAVAGLPKGAPAGSDIGVIHRDSTGVVRPYIATPFAEREPAISPDGKWLAYTSNENGREDVFVSAFPVPSGRYLVTTEGGHGATWSRNSRTIYSANGSSVIATPFTPGAPPRIGESRNIYSRDAWGSFSISSDGNLLLVTDRVREGDPRSLVVRLNAVH